jgi:hypothetical protein
MPAGSLPGQHQASQPESNTRNALLPSATEVTDPQLRYHALAPLHLRRKDARPVSYYAFFKGWLLLSQPPGCLCIFTSFPT